MPPKIGYLRDGNRLLEIRVVTKYLTSWTSGKIEHTPGWVSKECSGVLATYHRLNIGMRYSVEFVEFEFVLGADIDICPLVFSCIAILGRREDCIVLAVI